MTVPSMRFSVSKHYRDFLKVSFARDCTRKTFVAVQTPVFHFAW